MSEAYFYKGLTFEFDISGPLTIEGQRIPVVQAGDRFESPRLPGVRADSVLQLARLVIDHSQEFKRREQIKNEHLSILEKGVEHWNEWRSSFPEIRPILYEADLSESSFGHDLSLANFSYADLCFASLHGAKLTGANFHQAVLAGADLGEADLTGANFCRTDLYETNFSKARLINANLQGVQLSKTNFEAAQLIGCKVYGMSAWDLNLKDAIQEDLIIRYRYKDIGGIKDGSGETQITVDDIQVAQFIYLLLNNENIRNVINTVGEKGVLILGRFTKDRKAVLDALRNKLRELDFVPMIFDFDRPTERDFTETIQTLAGMSRFIIADITNPRSSPLELQALVPNYMIPLVPIIQENEEPFSMFRDLNHKYGDWVLDVLEYDSVDNLIKVIKPAIVRPALEKSDQLRLKKAEDLHIRRTSDYLASG